MTLRTVEGSLGLHGAVTWGVDDMLRMLQVEPTIANVTQPDDLRRLLAKAQRVLAPHRQRTRDSISHSVRKPKRLRELIRIARKRIDSSGTPPAPTSSKDSLEGFVRRVRLRLPEWIKLAHDDEVKPLLDNTAQYTHADFISALMRAQNRHLAPERHRERHSWSAGLAPCKGTNGVLYHLREAMRYPPIHSMPVMPPPAPEPVLEEPETTSPQPVDVASSGTIAAMQTFATTLSAAFGSLLRAHATDMMGQLGGALSQQAQDIGSKVTQSLQEHIQQTVHHMLEQELGPLSKDQEAKPTAPMPQAEPSKTPQRRIPVDVVGFSGAPIQQVRSAFNGEVDLRFISPEHAKSVGQQFRQNVVVVGKFISHSAKNRMRRQAQRFIPVEGGAAAVVDAIKRIQRDAHHH
jgi:hypothetical protein